MKTINKLVIHNIKGLQFLPCPVCGTKNSVPRANLRLRCSKCHSQLLSVKVRKNNRRTK